MAEIGHGADDAPRPTVDLLTTYSIFSGVDQLGIVGKVAPGIFAQGECWR